MVTATGRQSNRSARAILAGLSLALIAACEDPEVILPGEREPIGSVLSTFDGEAPDDQAFAANIAVPFVAPAPQNNADQAQFYGSTGLPTAPHAPSSHLAPL